MKQFCLFLSLLLFSSVCLAQTPTKMLIGVVGGPTYTNFRGEEQRNDHKSDFRKAIGVSLMLQKNHFFTKAEVLYENKGFLTNQFIPGSWGQPGSSRSLKNNFHYVTVPVLVGLSFERLGLFLNAGPFLGFLQKANVVNEYDEYDLTDSWEKTDLGVSGGIGYGRTLFSIIRLSAEVRHNIGLKDVDLRELNYKTNSTSLLLGIHYTLGGK
ncbi:porin family protein [Rufibacter immobilis]|uniref:porin family protein n=1 Tax=Rufibacter immobilis TaxID=1348778 RepID=UPI0035E74CB5